MKKLLFLFFVSGCLSANVFAQARIITGTVVDEKGLPVQAASIRIKHTSLGVAADNNGQFRIQVKPGDILVITGGIEQKEVTIGSETSLVIATRRQVIEDKEVFITTAMSIRKRPREVGFGNSLVKPDQFTNGHGTRHHVAATNP